ncbi:MAG: diguanylate cyclase [Acidobacteriota bacterium]
MPEQMQEAPAQTEAIAAAWKDAALLIIKAAADRVVTCGDADVESYRTLVRGSLDQLRDPSSPSHILITAGGLSQAISHHAVETQRRVDALLGDIGGTVQIFLEHLQKLYTDSAPQGIVTQLRSDLEAAIRTGKIGEARGPASQRLVELLQHAEEKRRQSLELTSKLQDRITILEQTVGSRTSAPGSIGTTANPLDASTGLPMRAEAEETLRRYLDGPDQAFAAVFYLHRMALTNARFGEAIGNQVILFCSQHIATTITRVHDSLFRWQGPAFVAIIERPESQLAVTTDVQRIISSPLSRFFETPSRSVYLPIKVTADVVPLFNTNLAEVVSHIERFILNASGQTQE